MARRPDSPALRGPAKAANRPVEAFSKREAPLAWAERNLSGRRLDVFRSWTARDQRARSRGYRLVRLQHTADPWDMSTTDEAAEGVYWYEVPLSTKDEERWAALVTTMESDERLTREAAERMGVNAKQLSSATPERIERLRKAFRERFGAKPAIPESAKGTK